MAEDYYWPLMENNPMKILSILFALVSSFIGSAMAFGMIWFEKFGSSKKRTVINQLVTASCWTYIFHTCFIVQLLEVMRYVYGPLPQAWCFAHSILRNSSLTVYVLYYDAMSVMRYAFIFWLKNPAAFSDDFWCCFISIWINGFSILVQFVWQFKAPRQPLGFYICSGIDLTEEFKKPLRIYGTLEMFSLLLNVAIYLRIRYFKKKLLRMVQPAIESDSRKKTALTDVDKSSLASKVTTFYMVISSFLLVLNQALLNMVDPAKINQFPYTFYVYYIFFLSPFLVSLCAMIIYYTRHSDLRSAVFSEIKEQCISIKESHFS